MSSLATPAPAVVTDEHIVVAASRGRPGGGVLRRRLRLVLRPTSRRRPVQARPAGAVAACPEQSARRDDLRPARRRRRRAGVLRGAGVVPRQHPHRAGAPRRAGAPARRRQGRAPDAGVLRDDRRGAAGDRRGHRPRHRRPARAGRHRRPCQLRLPAGRGPRRSHDRARLRLRPGLPQPRRPILPTSCASPSAWSASCATSAGRWCGCREPTSSCSCRSPTGAPCTSTSSAPSTSGDTFYQMGGRSGTLERDGPHPRLDSDARGGRARRTRRSGAGARVPLRPGWRVPDPSFQPVDPWPGLRRIDGWMRGVRTHVVRVERDLPQPAQGQIPRRRVVVREVDPGADPGLGKVVDLGSGHGPGLGAGSPAAATTWSDVDFSGAALRFTRATADATGRRGPDAPGPRPQRPARRLAHRGRAGTRDPSRRTSTHAGWSGASTPTPASNLWRLCSMSLRRGGSLFLEYAATRPGLRASDPGRLVSGVSTRTARARDRRPPVARSCTARSGPGTTSSTNPTPTSPGSRSVGTPPPPLFHPAPRRMR